MFASGSDRPARSAAQRAAAGDTQRLLDALGSPVRRDILWLVWDRERSAGEIARAFDLRPPTISQHLAVLREAGLVSLRREGTFRYYRARPDALARARGLVAPDLGKWAPSAEPAPAVEARPVAVVVADTEAPCDQESGFRAFTDPALYSRWLGAPVTLVDGAFTATMEWGLRVRGFYDHVLEPSLIAMTWDFEEGDVPVPGAGQRAYLELQPTAGGCRVIVRQLVADAGQIRRMERIWGLVLERFRANVATALDRDTPLEARPPTTRRKPGG